eukprot:56449-Eustigmatos_ZCMA.PRE.1
MGSEANAFHSRKRRMSAVCAVRQDAQSRWKDKVGDKKSWTCSCPSLCGDDNAAEDEQDIEALSPS